MVVDGPSWHSGEVSSSEHYAKSILQKILKSSISRTHAISTVAMNQEILDILFKAYQEDPEFKKIYKSPKNPFSRDSQLLYFKGTLCLKIRQMRKVLLQ